MNMISPSFATSLFLFSIKKQVFGGYLVYMCYNLKLGSGCNSGKDLSKSKEYDQLVKCKDTEMYLYYIYL